MLLTNQTCPASEGCQLEAEPVVLVTNSQESKYPECPHVTSHKSAEDLAPFGMIGVNHQTTSFDVRSRLSVVGDQATAFLALAKQYGVDECVVLSTCNRLEVYYAGATSDTICEILSSVTGVPTSEYSQGLYHKACVCAACHLFQVAAGLNSAVLGETEIVAQIKEAWRIANQAGLTGPMIDLLFQRGLAAGKRVRTETDLCRNATSVATLAVRAAERTAGDLNGRRVVVLGAGKIAERVLKELVSTGVKEVRVVNRTHETGEALASRYGFDAAPWLMLRTELHDADAVLTTLSVQDPLLSLRDLKDLAAAREGRPLAMVDLGLPPNVEPTSAVPGITVINMEQLTEAGTANSDRKAAAVPAAMAIIDEEIARFGTALVERAAAPTIRALVARGETIRKQNVAWAMEKLPDLDAKQTRVLEEMARRMMIGLLQAPIDRLKSDLSAPEHRDVVERLFALDDEDTNPTL